MPPLSPPYVPLVFIPPLRYRHPPQGGDTPWLRITALEDAIMNEVISTLDYIEEYQTNFSHHLST